MALKSSQLLNPGCSLRVFASACTRLSLVAASSLVHSSPGARKGQRKNPRVHQRLLIGAEVQCIGRLRIGAIPYRQPRPLAVAIAQRLFRLVIAWLSFQPRRQTGQQPRHGFQMRRLPSRLLKPRSGLHGHRRAQLLLAHRLKHRL